MTDPFTPEQRRRANRLGLLLGLGCLALVGVFITIFTLAGLPKGGKEWDRIQRQTQTSQTAPETTK